MTGSLKHCEKRLPLSSNVVFENEVISYSNTTRLPSSKVPHCDHLVLSRNLHHVTKVRLGGQTVWYPCIKQYKYTRCVHCKPDKKVAISTIVLLCMIPKPWIELRSGSSGFCSVIFSVMFYFARCFQHHTESGTGAGTKAETFIFSSFLFSNYFF